MNERIEQLAEQCWVHTDEPLFSVRSPHWEFDRQKFAELIIQECARRSKELGQPELGQGLMKHFGVDE